MLEDARMPEIPRQVPQANKVPKRKRDAEATTRGGRSGTRRPRPQAKDPGREDGDGYVPV